MSVRATNFIRRLRGLSPEEKAVAFVLADHDSHKGDGAYPSMKTVAGEAGLKNRETASRITKRLVQKKIFVPNEPSTREQGRPTVYHPNYDAQTCDSPITGGNRPTCDSPVTPPLPQPVTVTSEPVTLEGQTCDSPVTQRVEGRRGEAVRGDNSVQPSNLFKEVARGKNYSVPPWVKGDLAQSLYRGIHNRAIAHAFFDAKRLNSREQLAECIRAGTTSLVTSRVVTLKSLDANKIEDAAFREMLPGLETLSLIKNFETRKRQTVQAVVRVIVLTCIKMLKGRAA